MTKLTTIAVGFDDFVHQKYNFEDITIYDLTFDDFWKLKIYIIFFTLVHQKAL